MPLSYSYKAVFDIPGCKICCHNRPRNLVYGWMGVPLTYSTYTGCPRRNVPDFGRVFLMLKYTNITQNTYVQSRTVTEIMAREKCGLLAGPHTVPASWQSYPFPSLSVVSYDGNSAHAHSYIVGLYRNAQSAMLRHRWAFSCIVLGTLRTTMTWVRVFL